MKNFGDKKINQLQVEPIYYQFSEKKFLPKTKLKEFFLSPQSLICPRHVRELIASY